MIRLLVPPGTLAIGEPVELDAEEAHHLDVRRVASGSSAEALDGIGSRGLGVVSREGKQWSFVTASVVHCAPPAALVLAVGGGDKDRFLWLAEKCAELGVTRLIPIETTRSRHVESRLREGSIAKGRRRAAEACKQSGNPWAPRIDDLTPLDDLPNVVDGVRWLLADGEGADAPRLDPSEGVGWLIGPEGGFGEDDLQSIRDLLHPVVVRLGSHVLRFETAALAATVITADRRRDG